MDEKRLSAHPRHPLISKFDEFSDYTTAKFERDIHENRMGYFSLAFEDESGKRFYPERVNIRQRTHEFKFGSPLFLLGQLKNDAENTAYEDAFSKIFNYGVAPIYWDSLEPQRGRCRFTSDSERIWRRPPLDDIVNFARRRRLRLKAHCLAYNSFNPKWLPESSRELEIALDERIESLSGRYKYDFEDMDVINEMFSIYKNCYVGNGMRNLQLTDDPEHEKKCFDAAKRNFPHTCLYWNEGCFETFGSPQYTGRRSVYYLMLRDQIASGCKIEGIGMQFHAFTQREDELRTASVLYNPLRAIDVFDTYSEFKLPISISEISIPSWSNDADDEELQAELVKRMYTLWFSRARIESAVWWNMVDGTAYGDENIFHAGLLRSDLTPKPAYLALDRLINREWHTELSLEHHDNRYVFEGFYGDYDVEFVINDRKYNKSVRLFRDTTGYDNRLCDWRVSRIRF